MMMRQDGPAAADHVPHQPPTRPAGGSCSRTALSWSTALRWCSGSVLQGCCGPAMSGCSTSQPGMAIGGRGGVEGRRGDGWHMATAHECGVHCMQKRVWCWLHRDEDRVQGAGTAAAVGGTNVQRIEVQCNPAPMIKPAMACCSCASMRCRARADSRPSRSMSPLG